MVTVPPLADQSRSTTLRKPARRRVVQGFTLIEVMVSLLVLGTALVALNTLQLASLRQAHDALHHTLANVIAIDAAERLWLAHAMQTHPTPEDIQQQWLEAWRDPAQPHGPLTLHGIESSRIDAEAHGFVITVTWNTPRSDTGDQAEIAYRLSLPMQ